MQLRKRKSEVYREDLENKQISRKKGGSGGGRGTSKKKVLEEATNSKLREVEVRIEDCLLQQNGTQPAAEVLAALRRHSLEEESRHSIERVEEESREEIREEVEEEGRQEEESEGSLSAEDKSEEVSVVVLKKQEEHGDAAVGLEDDSSSGDSSSNSSVQLVSGDGVCGDKSVPVPVAADCSVVSVAADDCVIVPEGGKEEPEEEEEVPNKAECSSRGDDDGPLSSSSPSSFSSCRMELGESGNAAALLRFPDDRSDSGVSSLRSAGSGDERSGSRSSALSSSDEPPQQQTTTLQGGQQPPTNNRSPLTFVPNSGHSYGGTSAIGSSADSVRVWRGMYPNIFHLVRYPMHYNYSNYFKAQSEKLFLACIPTNLLICLVLFQNPLPGYIPKSSICFFFVTLWILPSF